MSDVEVDARGMTCPQPVIETRKVLLSSDAPVVRVLVDNEAASENVARMARSLGCEVRLVDSGDGVISLSLTREGGVPASVEETAADACGLPEDVSVLIASSTIGAGDDDLGRLLMVAFVKTLKDLVPRPRSLLFMNAGVRLTVKGSELLEAISDLEKQGVEVLVCGTCLDFFGLKEALAVGKISNMFELSSKMVAANKVLRP